MELLAPAGTTAVFATAIKAGADAVYIGAPALNARALGDDFTMADIAAMVDFAHDRGKKLYVAMNTLVKEEEIPLAIETLSLLEALRVDAVIIQDLGIYGLIRKYFPGLRIHASTLFGAHNASAVRFFGNMGFERVVLAREMDINEISRACRSGVDIEVFIHGALCFSYSGLCLFSSFLGGKSGLRGRCVQPCRRRYQWSAGKARRKTGNPRGGSGYFFSMNDLCGVEFLPRLRDAGVKSLKIEGRLRSVQYVGTVVEAYRTAMDGMNGSPDEWERALTRANRLLEEAMGRKTSSAFLESVKPSTVISPYHSGNIGIFLGRFERGEKRKVLLSLKQDLVVGDRVRLHQEKSGERVAFTLKKMVVDGKQAETAAAGDNVLIEVDGEILAGDSLYKVDSRKGRAAQSGGMVRPQQFVRKVRDISSRLRVDKIVAAVQGGHEETAGGGRGRKKGPQLWLKIDNLQVVKHPLPFNPDRLVIVLTRESFKKFLRGGNFLRQFEKKIIWSLPPIIHEPDMTFYQKTIQQLVRVGYRQWQIGHCSQAALFHRVKNCTLSADYTVNVLNAESVGSLRKMNIKNVQLHIETDRDNLLRICGHSANTGRGGVHLGMTVYGWPPLFTARLDASHFIYNRSFVSPKNEIFFLTRGNALTLVLPDRPFSLINEMGELVTAGISYMIVDLTNRKPDRKEMEELGKMLSGRFMKKGMKSFNYHGNLL